MHPLFQLFFKISLQISKPSAKKKIALNEITGEIEKMNNLKVPSITNWIIYLKFCHNYNAIKPQGYHCITCTYRVSAYFVNVHFN